MNKKEWEEVFDIAGNKAREDYDKASQGTKDEYVSLICKRIFDYLYFSIKEIEED